ncbi:MAG TPA: penicillin-binding transpeptidase domain-containing protein [Acidimicrobiales bacterium]|nr:penicillin-binding transpeptidase domain-containing protein [Acidimicrobiales bacterium]
MNDRIQRLGLILGVAFCLLLASLTRLQVVDASKLTNDPRNSRGLTAAFSAERGSIQTNDGVLLAKSVASNDEFKQQRQYPQGAVFAPVTGYLSFTYGADGAERAFNTALVGGALPKGDDALRQLFEKKRPTQDVTLTISAAVQRVAASALGDRRGAVIALDPTTGAILAMVSSPSYDPNPLAAHSQDAVRGAWNGLQNDPAHPLLPRAYRESYPPGSTFKVVTASAAFDHDPDITSKVYPTMNALPLPHSGGLSLHNFGGERCGGTIADLLRVSCNTGMASVGLDVGATNMAAEATAFGFGNKPPLDLPAAAVSHFPDATEFKRLLEPGLAFSSIGQQDVSATPLQMALVASAIANGGIIMTPHVLDHTSDDRGNVVSKYKPSEWRTATSGATAAVIKQMMIDVARRGTATRAQIPGVTVAAKTGTAQTGKPNTSHAWLIAFAPAEAPKVAVAVIVESQQGTGDAATGGRVAAPIAQAVMRAALGA